MTPIPATGPAVRIAMIGAAAVLGQFVGGKAARDALFLARFEVTALPSMVMAGSAFSIACAFLMSRAFRHVTPARLLPAAFAGSAALFVMEWALGAAYPRAGAVLFYLHMLGPAPVLVSGFWTLLSERLDPRTAKRRLGHIGAAATFGGLAGSLIAERAAVWSEASAMVAIVSALNLGCAWAVWQLASVHEPGGERRVAAPTGETGTAAPSGLAVVARSAHLRNLAALVLLATLGAGLLDYVFKAGAVAAIGRGDSLLRFFALYYGAQNVLTFLSQVTLSRPVLEKLGLGPSVGLPSLAVVVGGLGALAVPGLPSLVIARGVENIGRSSLFRSAYELLYNPVPSVDKRAAKPIIDVAFDRAGDLAGAAVARIVLASTRAGQHAIILLAAVVTSAAALVVARRVTRGYIQSLERSLLDQAVHLDVSEVSDLTTRLTLLRTLATGPGPSAAKERRRGEPIAEAAAGGAPRESREPPDPLVQRIVALRSKDRDRVVRALREAPDIDRVLVPHVIPLLAWDPVAPDAILALQKVAEATVGQLVDSLLDPGQDFTIRRRLARVLWACTSQRAVDGLLLALDDRFEVRFQCGRSLVAIAGRDRSVRIDPDRIYQVVLREVSVGRPVWEGHRLLDALEAGDGDYFVDRFIGERAGQSMAHVFTLLSLVLHREPLQVAFRGLHVDDPLLRGTALEYLESVLPQPVRSRLWPFLEDSRPAGRSTRSRDEIIADLLRSNDSMVLRLAELERRAGRPRDAAPSMASQQAGGVKGGRAR
jgi:ATP:ADP antiporter, AAA family